MVGPGAYHHSKAFEPKFLICRSAGYRAFAAVERPLPIVLRPKSHISANKYFFRLAGRVGSKIHRTGDVVMYPNLETTGQGDNSSSNTKLYNSGICEKPVPFRVESSSSDLPSCRG